MEESAARSLGRRCLQDLQATPPSKGLQNDRSKRRVQLPLGSLSHRPGVWRLFNRSRKSLPLSFPCEGRGPGAGWSFSGSRLVLSLKRKAPDRSLSGLLPSQENMIPSGLGSCLRGRTRLGHGLDATLRRGKQHGTPAVRPDHGSKSREPRTGPAHPDRVGLAATPVELVTLFDRSRKSLRARSPAKAGVQARAEASAEVRSS
jgi:hypothetical protein